MVHPLRAELEASREEAQTAQEQANSATATAQRASAEASSRRAQVSWAGGRIAQLEGLLKASGVKVPEPEVPPPPPPPQHAKPPPASTVAIKDSARARVLQLEEELKAEQERCAEAVLARDTALRALEAQSNLSSGGARRVPSSESLLGLQKTTPSLLPPPGSAAAAVAAAALASAHAATATEARRADAMEAARAQAEERERKARATAISERERAERAAAEKEALQRELEAVQEQLANLSPGQQAYARPAAAAAPQAPAPPQARTKAFVPSDAPLPPAPPSLLAPTVPAAQHAAAQDRLARLEKELSKERGSVGDLIAQLDAAEKKLARRDAELRKAQALQAAPARPPPSSDPLTEQELARLQGKCRTLQEQLDLAESRVRELENPVSRPGSAASWMSRGSGASSFDTPAPTAR